MKISCNANEFLFHFYHQTKILLSFLLSQKYWQYQPQTNQNHHDHYYHFCLLKNISNINHKQTKTIMINYTMLI